MGRFTRDVVAVLAGLAIWNEWSSKHFQYLIHTKPGGQHVPMWEAAWVRTPTWSHIVAIVVISLWSLSLPFELRERTRLRHIESMRKAANWIAEHIDHDDRYDSVLEFRASAHSAAGIPSSTAGRETLISLNWSEELAGLKSLRIAKNWMEFRIIQHCNANREPSPPWISRYRSIRSIIEDHREFDRDFP